MNLFGTETNLKTSAELLREVVGQFVVRPAGVAGGPGLSGFVFNILAAEESELTADITNHYVEDNTAIQDHVALRPEKFKLKGFIGEVSDIIPAGPLQLLAAAARLARVDVFGPEFTVGARQVYDEISDAVRNANNVVNEAQSLYGLFAQKGTSSSKQQNAYGYLYSMMQTRQFCTVQTPWNILENMMIDSVMAVQDEDTQVISSFTVTLQKIRVAQTITVGTSAGQKATQALGRVADMISPVAQKGRAVGKSVAQTQLNIDFGEARG